MDQTRNRSADSSRFAVNRVYQPARIERELLAQIFDLVEQGGRKNIASGDARQEPVINPASAGSTARLATSLVCVSHPTQIIELEEVA